MAGGRHLEVVVGVAEEVVVVVDVVEDFVEGVHHVAVVAEALLEVAVVVALEAVVGDSRMLCSFLVLLLIST